MIIILMAIDGYFVIAYWSLSMVIGEYSIVDIGGY